MKHMKLTRYINSIGLDYTIVRPGFPTYLYNDVYSHDWIIYPIETNNWSLKVNNEFYPLVDGIAVNIVKGSKVEFIPYLNKEMKFFSKKV
jgi:hypothetical protein